MIKFDVNFGDILCSDFVGLGVLNTVGSGVGSVVEILSRFFIENILLLKWWILCSLALRNNHKLFIKMFIFSTGILHLFTPLSLLTNLFYFSQYLLMAKFPLYIS